MERALCPKDAPAAPALFQNFIESEASWFRRADDSNNVIGDVVSVACQHWLRAAARCKMPAEVWPQRVFHLYAAHKYGARDALLRAAGLLLNDEAQRARVARINAQLAALVAWRMAVSFCRSRP